MYLTALLRFDVHQQVLGGILYNAKLAIRKKILRKLFFFIRHQPCKVRLVFGINTCHEFDIRAVVIGEATVPCTAEVSVSPRPLFLSGRHMMTCHMKHSRLCVEFVPPFEVVLRIHTHV